MINKNGYLVNSQKLTNFPEPKGGTFRIKKKGRNEDQISERYDIYRLGKSTIK